MVEDPRQPPPQEVQGKTTRTTTRSRRRRRRRTSRLSRRGGGGQGRARQKQQGEGSKQSRAKQKRQGKTRQGRAGTKHTTSSEGRKREETWPPTFLPSARSNGIPAGIRTQELPGRASRAQAATPTRVCEDKSVRLVPKKVGRGQGRARQKQQGEDSKQSRAKQKRQGKTRQGRAGTKHTTSSEGRSGNKAGLGLQSTIGGRPWPWPRSV